LILLTSPRIVKVFLKISEGGIRVIFCHRLASCRVKPQRFLLSINIAGSWIVGVPKKRLAADFQADLGK
jgi:hypothetical protein